MACWIFPRPRPSSSLPLSRAGSGPRRAAGRRRAIVTRRRPVPQGCPARRVPAGLPPRLQVSPCRRLGCGSSNSRGLWYSPPERIRGVVTFGALARSPVDDAAPAA